MAVVFAALASGCALTPLQTDLISSASAPRLIFPPRRAAEAAAERGIRPVLCPGSKPRVATLLPTQARPSPASREIKDSLRAIPTIDLTSVPPDLWDRIRNGFAIPDLSSPLVQDRQIWYASQPSYVKRMVERGKRYLYYIVEELEKRGMPTELALLPMVESAFNPMAYSRSRASGLWQFIPSTGKNYNLEQNSVVSTAGATSSPRPAQPSTTFSICTKCTATGTSRLPPTIGGENAVARAIEKNQAKGLPTDYLSLNLPTETRYYVPKLQALKNIIENPHAFGIDLDPCPTRPISSRWRIPATSTCAWPPSWRTCR